MSRICHSAPTLPPLMASLRGRLRSGCCHLESNRERPLFSATPAFQQRRRSAIPEGRGLRVGRQPIDGAAPESRNIGIADASCALSCRLHDCTVDSQMVESQPVADFVGDHHVERDSTVTATEDARAILASQVREIADVQFDLLSKFFAGDRVRIRVTSSVPIGHEDPETRIRQGRQVRNAGNATRPASQYRGKRSTLTEVRKI